jgi:nucleoside-diphosphate-sugar epimerase
MSKKPLCLVTGACGFMGTHMVEVLHEAGYNIRATDLPTAYPDDNKKRGLFPSILRSLGVEFVGADLTDAAAIKPLVKDVEIIFHIAGLFKYSATWEALEAVNVGGTRNLLEAALAEGNLKRFIMWGAGGVYGIAKTEMLPLKEDMQTNPPNNYLKSKDLAEKVVMELCEKNNIPHAVLRPTTVYGPRAVYGGGQFVMGMAKMNPAMIPSNFTGRVPFIHVRDVVGSALHLAEYQGEVKGPYNCNDNSTMTAVEVSRFFAMLMGNMFIKLPPIPKELIIAGVGKVAGVVEHVARDILHLPSPVEADMLGLSIGDFVYDNQKLRDTGYEFLYPDPRPGLRDTITWYREQGWM